MVKWSQLFDTLLERKVECIFLRLMLYIYENQSCKTKWCDESSRTFSVSNGVRQGAVSSAVLFSVYIDDLLRRLEESGLGCHIHGIFFGAFIFADDIFLLSATVSGLQSLVNICQDFASTRNLTFGTNPVPSKSKTKCISFSKRTKDHKNLTPILLGGVPLPKVRKVTHLGCVLESDNSMRSDIALKRGQFIGKVNSLLQEFHFASLSVKLKLLNVFATSFYGSSLWDPFSSECEKLYRSWNVTVRNILNVDRKTHRFLIEAFSEGLLHPKIMIASRLAQFYKSQYDSPKFVMRFLVRLTEGDFRTKFGTIINRLATECNCSIGDLNGRVVKSRMKYREVPKEELWRVPLGKELIGTKNGNCTIPGFSNDEVEDLFQFVCALNQVKTVRSTPNKSKMSF